MIEREHGRALYTTASSRRRSGTIWRTLLLPVFLALAAFLAYEALGPLADAIPSAVLYVVIGGSVLLSAVRFFVSQRYHFGSAFDVVPGEEAEAERVSGESEHDLRLLTGEVLHRGEAHGDKLFTRAIDVSARWIDFDVVAAAILDPDGCTHPAPNLRKTMRLTVGRDDYRLLRPRQRLAVVCTAAGRVLHVADHDAGPPEV